MGTKASTHTGIANALFPKTRQKILGLLHGKPDKSYFLNEIARSCNMGKGAVQRELENLANAGILAVRRAGNQKHYQANPRCPIFEELRSIARKSFGIADAVTEALASLQDRIQVAFIFGSVAKGSETSDSDVDLLLVAESLSFGDLFAVLSPLEQQLGRRVNPTLYTAAEFHAKLAADQHFLSRVMQQPKIYLMGGENDLAGIGEPGGHPPAQAGAEGSEGM